MVSKEGGREGKNATGGSKNKGIKRERKTRMKKREEEKESEYGGEGGGGGGGGGRSYRYFVKIML